MTATGPDRPGRGGGARPVNDQRPVEIELSR